jgi:hypothetical protein
MDYSIWRKKWSDATNTFIKEINVPHSITLVISPEELLAPSKKNDIKNRNRKGTGKSGRERKIPRPQNPYVLYRKYQGSKNPSLIFNNLSKKASQEWQKESQDVRNFFAKLAAIGELIHKNVFPQYKYKPRERKKVKKSTQPDKMAISFLLQNATNNMTSTDGINELGDSSYLFIQITNNI